MLDLNKINIESVQSALMDNETKQLIENAAAQIERIKIGMTTVQDKFSNQLTFSGLLKLKEILEISKTTLIPLIMKLEEKKLETIEKLCDFNNG